MKNILVTDHVFPNLDPENAVLEGIGTLREAGSVSDAELLELARDADAVLNCYRPLSACAVTRRRFSSGCKPHPAIRSSRKQPEQAWRRRSV
jgi:hypothetical protein